MLDEKMTLLQFFYTSPAMVRFVKLKNWLAAENVLYHFMVYPALYAHSGSVRGLTLFRALGA